LSKLADKIKNVTRLSSAALGFGAAKAAKESTMVLAGIAKDIPALDVFGPSEGDLLILGWGSTFGAIRSAVERLQARGVSVSHAHLRHLNPFPPNTEAVVRSFRRVLIPELNLGHLLMLVRARYLIDAIGYNRVRGKPFRIGEIEAEAERIVTQLAGSRA